MLMILTLDLSDISFSNEYLDDILRADQIHCINLRLFCTYHWYIQLKKKEEGFYQSHVL